MSDFEHVTTSKVVDTYNAISEIFEGLLSEMRELSKKKPEVTLSKNKVEILNRMLKDLQNILKDEPEEKYLDLLDDETLPQTSDAVLVMVQYEKALVNFKRRYQGKIGIEVDWITKERLREWEKIRR